MMIWKDWPGNIAIEIDFTRMRFLTLALTLTRTLTLTLTRTRTRTRTRTLPRSAYLFMCGRPRSLRLPVRVSGQHKIWLGLG